MGEIPWDTLKTVSFPFTAERIPAALEQLQSPDPHVRQNAEREMRAVVVQGYLSEAAPFVALELLSRLRQGLVRDKEWAYELLFEMGHNGFDAGAERVNMPDGRMQRLPQACREIMESGLDLYEKDLLSSDPVLRDLAIDLVLACGLRKPAAQQVFQRALENAPTEAMRQALLQRNVLPL